MKLGNRSALAAWLLATAAVLAPVAHAVDACSAVFPTPLAAHDPVASLAFLGGRVSGSPVTQLQARIKPTDISLLPRSCNTASCTVSGQPSATVALPVFQTTAVATQLAVGWFGNTSYAGATREFGTVSVGLGGQLAITPTEQQWRIRTLSLAIGSTLTLAPGDYWVEHLDFAGGSIKVSGTGAGTVRIFLKNAASIPGAARLNPGSNNSYANSEKLLLVGWNNITFGAASKTAATVYAAGAIRLDAFAYVRGNVAGASATLGLWSEIAAIDQAQRANTQHGLLCHQIGDIDGDGIPDDSDPDRDGDGFDNDAEIAAGTDPNDPADFPDTVPPSLTTTLIDALMQEAEELSVTGSASDTGGPHQGVASVRVLNVASDTWTDANVASGQYVATTRLIFGDNLLNIVARDASGNETTLSRTVSRVDHTNPVVTIAGEPTVAFEGTAFTLTGNANDGANGSGISTLYATSDRQGSTHYALTSPDFSAAIPVLYGANVITVHATDVAGNTATAEKTVTRIESVPPVLTLANPPAQTVRAPVVTVYGSVHDNAGGSGVDGMTVTSDRAGVPPVSLVPDADGGFSTPVALLAGANTLTVRAHDAFNNQAVVTIVVTRPDIDNDGIPDDIDPDRDGDGFSNADEITAGTNPDDAADYPDKVAPALTTTLVDNSAQPGHLLVVVGTATDAGGPHAGIASVLVKNTTNNYSFDAIRTGENYTADVQLVFGTNTVTITATDHSGNEAVLTRTVQRIDTSTPEVVLAGTASETTTADSITLTGTASDGAEGSGVVRVYAGSDRQLGEMPATRNGDAFTVAMPLAYGDNLIHVYADDALGNVGVATKTVRRTEAIAPTLTLANPAQQTLLAANVTIAGIALDNDGGSGVVDVTITNDRGDAPQVLVPAADGSFSTVAALAVGSNHFTVAARDQFGNHTDILIEVIRPDSDNDGIPDDTDDDRDGDGYSNIVEQNAGTNPDDAQDYPDTVAPQLGTDILDNLIVQPASLAVTGTISDAGGPRAAINLVRVYNAATTTWTDAFIVNGHYSATVALVFGDNLITVFAADASGNQTVITRLVSRVDSTAPAVTLTGAASETADPTFTLTGTASDGADGSGLDRVYLTRDNQPAQTLLALTGDAFTSAVALTWGDNLFTVFAEDGAGNVGTATQTILRTEHVPPTLTLGTASPQTLRAATITITGTAVDNPGGSGVVDIVISSNRGAAPVTVTPDADGSFSATIELAIGTNTFTVTARDLIGNTTQATLVITRPDLDGDGTPDDIDDDRDGDGYSNADEAARGTNPDAAQDFPDDVAPQLTLDNPAAQTIAAAQILVSGTATDNRMLSSVSIRSDRYGSAFAATMGEGGHFSATVPLAIGANALTVTATDGWGNVASAPLAVQRISPPSFDNVTPASGSVSASDRVTIAGVIRTDLDNDQLRLSLNGSQVIVGDGGSSGAHPFRIDGVPLEQGLNRFVLSVNSPDGSDTRTLDLNYIPADAQNLPPPALMLLAPVNGHWQSGDAVQVTGRVSSQAGRVTVHVNGAAVALPGDGTAGTFNTVRYFAEGSESLAVTVTATDALGHTSTANATAHRDLTDPVITLDSALAPMPADNLQTESPYILAGTVRDPRLAGMLINDEAVTLETTTDADVFRFSKALPLLAGGSLVTLTASDTAGNITQQAYHLAIDPSALIEVILPLSGAHFASEGEPVDVQVAARLSGEAAGAEAFAIVTAGANSNTFPLTLDGTLVSGNVQIPVTAGVVSQNATIRFEVRHASVGLVAATQVGVTVDNIGAQPVAVTQISPAIDSSSIATNAILTVFFNKPVDPTKVTLDVRETLHGKTYLNQDPPGTDFTRMKGAQLVDVNRDRESVPGTVDALPGGKTFVFTPERFFGYSGTVYFDISYDGEKLTGAQWTVEALPTQVSGNVVDQFGKAAQDVTVALGNLKTTTNADGAFSFGFDGDSRRSTHGGEYALELNPGQVDPRFGYRRQTVLLDEGRYRHLGQLVLPLLNERTGFDALRQGVRNEVAGGKLIIDLSGGTVRGPSGTENPLVNVQLLGAAQLGYPFGSLAPVGGAYVLEPAWLSATGSIQLDVALPNALAGFEDGDPVFFLGLDADRARFVPIAVGEVTGGRVVQRGNWHGQWLDAIGIAPIPAASMPAVNDYLDAGGSWSTVLGGLPQ